MRAVRGGRRCSCERVPGRTAGGCRDRRRPTGPSARRGRTAAGSSRATSTCPRRDWVARTLAARGVTVVSVDYRLAGDGCRYPAPSDDVLAAWRVDARERRPARHRPRRGSRSAARARARNLVAGAVLRLLDDGRDAEPRRSSRRAVDAVGARSPTLALVDGPTRRRCPPACSSRTRRCSPCSPSRMPRCGPCSTRTPTPTASARTRCAAMYERLPRRAGRRRAARGGARARAAASDLAGFPPVLMINDEVDELRVSGEAVRRDASSPPGVDRSSSSSSPAPSTAT